MARRGRSRHGPTLREAILVHAVARIALGRDIPNIQTSWVKMGRRHALDCLAAGANDLGGTLMNESITRAAGAVHGQCWAARDLRQAIEARGRAWRLRRTDYGDAPPERVARALAADAAPSRPINHPAGRRARGKGFGDGIAEITLDCEAPGK